ncbi:MAG: hypothetical protein R6V06_01370 [Kiritimatiellia bacterium]
MDTDYIYFERDARNYAPYTLEEGSVSDIRFWNRALSNDEVAGLAASNAVPVEGLIGEYDTHFTNNLHLAGGFSGEQFLRSFSSNSNFLSLSFSGLPKHNNIGLGMLLAQLDDLEPSQGTDHFKICIDGNEILRVGLGYGQENEPTVNTFELFGIATDVDIFENLLTLGGADFFFCGTADLWDHVYDLSQLTALQKIPHTDSTLHLDIVGIHDSTGDDESFGIDKIELNVISPPGTVILIK